MTGKTNHAPTHRPLTRMTAAELADATRGAENINFEDTRPLSPAMAAEWDRAKRGRGRPRIGEGAEKVLISMEKRLLLVTDTLARRKGLDRSKLIALAVREMLERQAATEHKQGSATGKSDLPSSSSRKFATPRAAGKTPMRKTAHSGGSMAH